MNRLTPHLAVALLSFGLGIGTSLASQSVRIVVKTPVSTAQDAAIYLTGSSAQLCGWQPRCLRMKQIGVQTYEAEVERAPESSPLEFKVTRGTWESEAATVHSESLSNFRLDPETGPVQVISIVNWKDHAPLGVSGTLEVFPDFRSPQLGNSRRIWVWTPPGYGRKVNERYAVVYMHDGQNLFDPRLSNTQVDWQVDESLLDLIQKGRVPPAIVVGVECNENRRQEYDYTTEAGARYADFLIQTLKPFIDSKYRTRPGRESTFSAGSSMGALISIALVWNLPDVFSRAGAISLPALIKDQVLDRIVAKDPPSLPIQIYMDHGDWGGDAPYGPPAKAFYESLRRRGFTDRNLIYQVFPYADHTEIDWARRLPIALAFLLK